MIPLRLPYGYQTIRYDPALPGSGSATLTCSLRIVGQRWAGGHVRRRADDGHRGEGGEPSKLRGGFSAVGIDVPPATPRHILPDRLERLRTRRDVKET